MNFTLFGGASLSLGSGRPPPGFLLGFRPEGFLAYRHLGLGAFLEISATVGQDLVLAGGPALVVSSGHSIDTSPAWGLTRPGVTITPGVYGRSVNGSWEPGLRAGLAVRMADRFGLGIDGRVGLGPSHERVLLLTVQLDLLFPIWRLVMPRHGFGSWI